MPLFKKKKKRERKIFHNSKLTFPRKVENFKGRHSLQETEIKIFAGYVHVKAYSH